MRVLFTTAPLHGHFFPLVPLGWACRSMGHEVLVATTDHFVGAATQSGLSAAPTGPGIRIRELAGKDDEHGIDDARLAHGQVFALMASRNLAGTLAVVDSWRPDVVVSERAELAGPIAAAARGVPHVELQWGVAELQEYRAAGEAALGLSLRRLGLAGLPSPDLTLNPWPPSLRLPHAAGHLSLRHVPYNGVARVSDWMLESGGRPRVCLTLGTVLPHLAANGMTGVVLGMLRALAELDCELIVVVDDDFAEHLRPLPAAVRHAGRVPLSDVLGSCDLLVHHGGQGTSLTALAAGCPQVVLPQLDDQIENSEAVVKSGAGLSLPLHLATPELVAAHCRRILGDRQFAESASAAAREIAAQPSPVRIVGAIEQLAARLGFPGRDADAAAL